MKNKLHTRFGIIAFLILCSLMISLTATSITPKQLAASKSSVQPKPAPTPLTKEDIVELVEELSASLEEVIDDEDAQEKITDKWEEKIDDLVGKTRKEVIESLFEDVKSVVEDKEKTDKLWENWSSDEEGDDADENDADETEGAGPTLTTEEKKKKGATEVTDFKRFTEGVRFEEEKQTIGGQTYTIYKDKSDPNLNDKLKAIRNGIKIMADKKLILPKDLKFYCVGKEGTPAAIALKRDENWKPLAIIILGKRFVEPTSIPGFSKIETMSGSGFGGLEKGPITVIHEIGHILHERVHGDASWNLPPFKNEDNNQTSFSAKVSNYAGKNPREFVAEVFAGTVIGMKFPADVLAKYKAFGGPTLPK